MLAKSMVSTGSFSSANRNLASSAYPDANSKAVGQAIVDAGNNCRFDMSDLAPASPWKQRRQSPLADLMAITAGTSPGGSSTPRPSVEVPAHNQRKPPWLAIVFFAFKRYFGQGMMAGPVK